MTRKLRKQKVKIPDVFKISYKEIEEMPISELKRAIAFKAALLKDKTCE